VKADTWRNKDALESNETIVCENNIEMNIKSPRLLLGLAAAIALAMLLPCLGSVVGLHGDEAWAGLRAAEILHGLRPLLGMNEYTGPFHQYLIAAVFSMTGFSVGALRLTTAICFLMIIPIYFRVARFFFDEWTAGIAVLILVTCPFFVAYGRTAVGEFALGPLFALGAIGLLVETSRGRAACFFAGVLLGLGCWNHLIFFAWVISLFLTSVCFYRANVFRSREFFFNLIGLTLVGIVRIFVPFPSLDLQSSFFESALRRLKEWPIVFAQVLHGDELFLRYTGTVKMSSFQILVPLIVAGSVVNLYKHFKRPLSFDRPLLMLLFFFLSLFIGTAFICPGNSDRYFLLPVFWAPLLAAVFFRQFTIHCGKFLPIAMVGLGVFLCSQLARTEINYFLSFLESGGREAKFSLGSEPETSNHFVRTESLGGKLRELGARSVVAEFFIAEPLKFYRLGDPSFPLVFPCESAECVAAKFGQENLFAVTYNDGLIRLSPEQLGAAEQIYTDSHFKIFKIKP
jgi:4-amino-4-deoxy-L-arabinose transferase-like glycosyltransferase